MNKVIGFQITAQDESVINTFYQETFGWHASAGPHEHVTNFDTGNESLQGSVIGRGGHIPDYVSLFVETDNLEETVETAVSNGATLIRPPFTLPDGVTLAIIADPEGHIVTLQLSNA